MVHLLTAFSESILPSSVTIWYATTIASDEGKLKCFHSGVHIRLRLTFSTLDTKTLSFGRKLWFISTETLCHHNSSRSGLFNKTTDPHWHKALILSSFTCYTNIQIQDFILHIPIVSLSYFAQTYKIYIYIASSPMHIKHWTHCF